MSKSLVAALCAPILAVLATCGCVSMSKGPSDEELVKARVDEFWPAFTAHDVERIMACVSENFSGSWFKLSNKAALEELLNTAWTPGTTENEQVDTSKAGITIRNDTATAAPFNTTAYGGCFVLYLKKEEAVAKPAANRKEEAGKNPKLDWFITDIVNEDEKLVRARVDEFWAGFTVHDIERVMACVSENFNSSWFKLSSKAAWKEVLQATWTPGNPCAKEQVVTSNAIITIHQNDTATTHFFWVGNVGYMLMLKKEEVPAKPEVDRREGAAKEPKMDWFITDMIAVGAHS